MERRDFLRGLGRAMRHPVLETERLADEADAERLPPERVLVLGAGPAGLGAARALRAEDVDVTVIEARDRVGGRCFTADADGVPVDLGAAFVQGTLGNPLADLAAFAGVALVPSDLAATDLLDAAGRLPDDEAADALDRYERLLADLAGIRHVVGPDASVGDAIAHLVADGRPEPGVPVETLLRAELALAHPADIDRLALSSLLADTRLPGEDALVAGGLGALVESLADDVDVRLEERVVHVSHGDRAVEVTTSSGSHVAHRAIIALPLGVLAAGAVTFDPPLPEAVLAALAGVDPGPLTTIAVRLDEPLTPPGVEFLAMPAAEAGAVGSWAVLDQAAGAPVLVGWAHGRAVDAIAADDDTAVERAIALLARALGLEAPRPVWRRVVRWGDDPLALGGISSLPAGADPLARRALRGALSPRLLLAGEAGADAHPGSAHGALLSGEREATRCIELMRSSR